MRKTFFTKKLSFLVASTLVLSLLSTSIVYACSKLDPMNMALQLSSMNGMDGMNKGMIERGPCANHKQGICKSVRDRLLSIQPSPSKAGEDQAPLLLMLPLNLVIDIQKHIGSPSASPGMGNRFSLCL